MIRNLKLFSATVESMRTAEKEYMTKPTPANKNIMVDLQKKVDAWVKWIKSQEEAELVKNVPPFIRHPQSPNRKEISPALQQQLLANHTPEEIDKFFRSIDAF